MRKHLLLNKIIIAIVPIITLLMLYSCHTTKKMATSHTGKIQLTEVDSTIVFEPDIHTGDKNGYASMRIPALIRTSNGALLAFCEGRVGTASDWAEMDLLLRRSLDGGKTWLRHQIVAPREKGPTSNATPILSKDGTVHLLYQRDYARAYYIRSTDQGKTWSAPVDITATIDHFRESHPWNVLAPGPGHGIQLENGRLLAPIWLADSPVKNGKRKHSPSYVATIYSDDLGKTWQRGAVVAASTPEMMNPNESVLVQLQSGRIMINIRSGSNAHLRATSISPDGISGWSTPVYDSALFDPICMAGLIRLPQKRKEKWINKDPAFINHGNTILAFSNPDSRDIAKTPRQNLTLKISTDGGGSWPVRQIINKGASGYSDLAIDPDGYIYCLYETNTVGKGWNYSLVLKKIKWGFTKK